jgi:hypothetical protein
MGRCAISALPRRAHRGVEAGFCEGGSHYCAPVRETAPRHIPTIRRDGDGVADRHHPRMAFPRSSRCSPASPATTTTAISPVASPICRQLFCMEVTQTQETYPDHPTNQPIRRSPTSWGRWMETVVADRLSSPITSPVMTLEPSLSSHDRPPQSPPHITSTATLISFSLFLSL